MVHESHRYLVGGIAGRRRCNVNAFVHLHVSLVSTLATKKDILCAVLSDRMMLGSISEITAIRQSFASSCLVSYRNTWHSPTDLPRISDVQRTNMKTTDTTMRRISTRPRPSPSPPLPPLSSSSSASNSTAWREFPHFAPDSFPPSFFFNPEICGAPATKHRLN